MRCICNGVANVLVGGVSGAEDSRTTMANLITLARFLLLFVLVAMAYWATPPWQLLNAPLLILIIALDGYVARRRNETTVFGSIFDIAVDRVVENVLWIVLGNLGLIPVWVAIVFIARGAIVDTIRYAAISGGKTVYGMMASRWGRALVSSRAMRAFYGALKAVTFAWVLLVQPLAATRSGELGGVGQCRRNDNDGPGAGFGLHLPAARHTGRLGGSCRSAGLPPRIEDPAGAAAPSLWRAGNRSRLSATVTLPLHRTVAPACTTLLSH